MSHPDAVAVVYRGGYLHLNIKESKWNKIKSAVPQSHRLAFQGPWSHMWLLATVLDREVEYFQPCWKFGSMAAPQWAFSFVLQVGVATLLAKA